MAFLIKKNLEIFLVSLIIIFSVFLAKYPTLHHYLVKPSALYYSGQATWFDAWDINVYVSYIRYGTVRGMILENAYTVIPHPGAFVFQVYTGLGLINRVIRIDPFLLFHMSAVVTGFLLLALIYYFLRDYVKDVLQRLAAFMLLAFGSGLGWMYSQSADYSVGGFSLIDPLERPHNALSTLFILASIGFFGRFLDKKKFVLLYASLLSSFLAYIIHPPLIILFSLVYLSGIILISENINKKGLLMPYGLFIISVLTYFLLFLLPFSVNPGFTGIVSQSLKFTGVVSLLMGLGLVAVGSFCALIGRDDRVGIKVVKIAFLLQLALSYAPLGFHLYFFKGFIVWAVILCVYGAQKLFGKYALGFLLMALLLSVPSRIGIFRMLMAPNYLNQYFYLFYDEGLALNSLSELPPGANILSLYRLGNYIPAKTDLKVYLGHRYQTPLLSDKLDRAARFYLSDDWAYQERFINENGIDYIYVGLEEQALRKNSGLNPFSAPYFLKPVYGNGLIYIYEAV